MNINYTRQKVLAPVTSISGASIFPKDYFTLSELDNYIKHKFHKNYTSDTKFKVEFYGSDGGFELIGYEERNETNDELNARIDHEVKMMKKQQQKDARDYQTYLALKAKFENEQVNM